MKSSWTTARNARWEEKERTDAIAYDYVNQTAYNVKHLDNQTDYYINPYLPELVIDSINDVTLDNLNKHYLILKNKIKK